MYDYSFCMVSFIFWLRFIILVPVRPRLLASYSVLYSNNAGLNEQKMFAFYDKTELQKSHGQISFRKISHRISLIQ